MKALRIEFGSLRRHPPWWSFVLFVLGVAACVSGIWRFGVASEQLAAVRAAAAQETARMVSSRPRKPSEPVFTLPPDQVKAINKAIDALNFPWNDLFGKVESLRSRDVALLALEPDGATQTVRMVAEARDAASMLAFVERLGAQGAFGSGVLLVKHELNSQDPDRPYRFEVIARWGDVR